MTDILNHRHFLDKDAHLGISRAEPNFLCPTIDRILELLGEIEQAGEADPGKLSSVRSLLEQIRDEAGQFRSWGRSLRRRIRELCKEAVDTGSPES